ncbi:MAG: FYDLN acid domain-containing protein [Methylocystis sp.]
MAPSLHGAIRQPINFCHGRRARTTAVSKRHGSVARRYFSPFTGRTPKGSIAVTKAELGVKRRCLSCNKPFFDLNRVPIVCPGCEAVF